MGFYACSLFVRSIYGSVKVRDMAGPGATSWGDQA